MIGRQFNIISFPTPVFELIVVMAVKAPIANAKKGMGGKKINKEVKSQRTLQAILATLAVVMALVCWRLISQRLYIREQALKFEKRQDGNPKMINNQRDGPDTPVFGNIRKMNTDFVEQVNSLVASHHVVIFSKSYCPYCRESKRLLESKVEAGLISGYHVQELDQVANGASIQDALSKITGQKTVPNIFIGGKHIGGNSDVTSLEQSGRLDSLLKAQ